MTVHGGDVWQVGEARGIPPRDLLDFSANINPRGLPPRAAARLTRDSADARLLSLYPDPSALSLRRALSAQLDISPDSIVVGPGAEALLSPIIRQRQPRTALLPIPAFSEYRRVCAQERVVLETFPNFNLCARIQTTTPDLVILNNPHNPTGVMLEKSEVLPIWEAARSNGATLLIDEAFVDYVPYATLTREAASHPGLIVLRSLTKFYGCPALRAGYAVAHPETIHSIRDFLPTWPVTQLALDALTEAIADREYAASSIEENAASRLHLAGSLAQLGCTVFPASANYLFLELPGHSPTSSDLRARLIANHRILIRNCDSYEGLAPGRYVRVAVRLPGDNSRLIHALHQELKAP